MEILPLTYQPENTHKAAHAAGGIAGIYTHAHTTQGGVQGHTEGGYKALHTDCINA